MELLIFFLAYRNYRYRELRNITDFVLLNGYRISYSIRTQYIQSKGLNRNLFEKAEIYVFSFQVFSRERSSILT